MSLPTDEVPSNLKLLKNSYDNDARACSMLLADKKPEDSVLMYNTDQLNAMGAN